MHICLSHDALRTLKVWEMIGKNSIPNLELEKLLHDRLSQHLVYKLAIGFNLEHIKEYKFVFRDIFPIFEKLKSVSKLACDVGHVLWFVVNSNKQVTGKVSDFMNSVHNIISNYQKFYSNHPTAHFLQVKDYLVAENQPVVHISALPTLDT